MMENAHTISALRAKIAHIQGEIELHYKAIKGLEIKANTLNIGKHFKAQDKYLKNTSKYFKAQGKHFEAKSAYIL